MNILILNYEYPPIGGGAGQITKNIAENLAMKGNKITILTTWYENLPEIDPINSNLKIIRLKSKRRHKHQSCPPEMISWSNLALSYAIKNIKPNEFDICLANFSIPGGWVAKKLLKKLNLPYTILSHGHDIPWYFKQQMFFYHCITYWTIKSICKKSSANFVQTAYMKTNIDRFTGKKLQHKNILIPNGVNQELPLPDLKSKSSVFTILFVGRMVKQKDPFSLMYALKKLAWMEIPFKAYFIGDGALRKRLVTFARKNKLDRNILFTGWIPASEVIAYHQKAHVMVMPSLAEGMSIANMEALACGVYLLATAVSGNKEMITPSKNGELIPQQGAIEIANRLQKFYFEQFLVNELTALQETDNFKNKYNWQNIADQYLNIFQSITNK